MSRRSREEREKRWADVARDASRPSKSAKSPPGVASKYIEHLARLVEAGAVRRAVLWCRVSERDQYRRGNATDQEANLRRELAALGVPVVDSYLDVGPGWDTAAGKLQEAIASARRTGAVVVAETADRFLRSEDFHTKDNPDALPTVAQFRKLAKLAAGVTLATVVDPVETPEEVRSYQSKRGQSAKENRGGRPRKRSPGYMFRRREDLLPLVLRLSAEGKSEREIERKTGVPRSTIQDWLRNAAEQMAGFSSRMTGGGDQKTPSSRGNKRLRPTRGPDGNR